MYFSNPTNYNYHFFLSPQVNSILYIIYIIYQNLTKNPRYILIPIHYSVNLYKLFSNLIYNYVIIPDCIFIFRPETYTFWKFCSHSWKHLNILKLAINLFDFLSNFLRIIICYIISYFFQVFYNQWVNPKFLTDYSPIVALSSSILNHPSPSFTASSASCNFIRSFFSARSLS